MGHPVGHPKTDAQAARKSKKHACSVLCHFLAFRGAENRQKSHFHPRKTARHSSSSFFHFLLSVGAGGDGAGWGRGAWSGAGVAWGAGRLGVGFGLGVLWGRKKTRRGIAAGFLFWVPLLWVMGLGFGWRWPRVGNRGIGLFHRLPNR